MASRGQRADQQKFHLGVRFANKKGKTHSSGENSQFLEIARPQRPVAQVAGLRTIGGDGAASIHSTIVSDLELVLSSPGAGF
jgi:hypothetical protein